MYTGKVLSIMLQACKKAKNLHIDYAYKIEKVGKKKYEAYIKKNNSKKIIFVYYFEFDTIFVITGSEGA